MASRTTVSSCSLGESFNSRLTVLKQNLMHHLYAYFSLQLIVYIIDIFWLFLGVFLFVPLLCLWTCLPTLQ